MVGAAGLRRVASTHALTAAVAGLALGLMLLQASAGPPAAGLVPWLLLAPLFAVGEVVVVHVALRSDRHTFSMTEIPLVLGAVSAGAVPLTGARLLGSAVVLLALHQRGTKLLFNLAQYALEVQVVLLVRHLLAGSAAPESLRNGIALIVACSSGAVISGLLIAVAVALHHRVPVALRGLAGGLVTVPLNAGVGVLCLIVLQARPWAIVLLLLLGGVLQVTLRRSVDLVEQSTRLHQLWDFTRRTNEVLDSEELVDLVVQQARTLLRAGSGGVLLDLAAVDAPGDRVVPAGDLLLLRSHSDRLASEQLLVSRGAPLARLMLDRLEPLLAGPGATGAAGQLLAALEAKDAVSAPLISGGRYLGALLMWDRSDDISTFDEADERLLATLASTAATSMNTSDLLQRLRTQVEERQHEAAHDSLTGLPNRRALQERLGQPVPDGSVTAVLLLDLDGFKEINDALGHSTGDGVLRRVAERLAAQLPAHWFIARLGGDEYAVVMTSQRATDTTGEEYGEQGAQLVLDVFHEPFAVEGMRLVVRTSVGVALSPGRGTDHDLLLKQADIAMYLAKAAGSGFAVYDPDRDPNTPDRLSLSADLRSAVHEGQIQVFYQPKALLGTGRLVGGEALSRWCHPERGWISPDVFIPIAEASGLVHELTLHVLDQALTQCARWRRADPELSVAVNLSVRSLLDPQLVDQVAAALARHRLPGQALVLEVTEGSAMSDLTRSATVLHALAGLGVRMAVDDFGTGYSSLAYLRRLPIHEVKIDKSFVLHLDTQPDDLSIVKAVVDLGHNLGLQVVAEGVETAATWELLHDLGCDIAQGYLLGRPMPAADFIAHVDQQESRAAAVRR